MSTQKLLPVATRTT